MAIDQQRKIKSSLVVLGFTTIFTQLIFIREFLNIFQGNELIIGLILFIWMLLTACGSRIANDTTFFFNSGKLSFLFIIEGVIPIITIIILYLLDHLLFPQGTERGLFSAASFCFLLLIPFCIVSGILFSGLAARFSQIANKSRISAAYGWESSGSVIAGLLYSSGLVYYLTTFQLLILLLALHQLIYLTLPGNKSQRWYLCGLSVTALTFGVLLLLSPFEKTLKSLHYKGQQLIYYQDTPYGNVSITAIEGQYNLYENNNLLFSTTNNLFHEEAVHFALQQISSPEKIMIVSGGLDGMTRQALKYTSISCVDYVELNPWLIEAETLMLDSLFRKNVNIVYEDARKRIKKSHGYDAIIVNTPDPSNAQINRYYTKEFFQEVKNALHSDGVFEISLSATGNYMTQEAAEVNSMLYYTLNLRFKNVIIIPGERNYFIASDRPIGIDIIQRIITSNIENDYVNRYYIEDDLLRQNNNRIMKEICAQKQRINTDMLPLGYYKEISNWLYKFEGEHGIIAISAIFAIYVIMLLFITRKGVNVITTGIFSGAFTGASVEFIMLIMFQIFFGYIYRMLGLIIALYMIGLTIGSLLNTDNSRKKLISSFLILQIVLLAFVLVIPVFFNLVSVYPDAPAWIIQFLLFFITFCVSFISGIEFNIAARLTDHNIKSAASYLYGIDLSGAATGTILTAIILFPVCGLLYSCIFISAFLLINISGLIFFKGRSITA